MNASRQVAEAVTAIRRDWDCVPRVGIILGTGLGDLADQIEVESQIGYEAIPHFCDSTAIGHNGRLVCGQLNGVPVATMDGRFHLYEGYSAQQVAMPVRVLRELGIDTLIISNACGGLNPEYCVGDVVVISDQINLMWKNPLIGPNCDDWGPRFPDMACPYDRWLSERALQVARRAEFTAHRGVYAGVVGPNYETRAEYRFLRRIGADVVGMSTIPEVLVAVHAGIRVLGLSAVTNVCRPDCLGKTDGHEVARAARSTEWKLRGIVLGVLDALKQNAP